MLSPSDNASEKTNLSALTLDPYPIHHTIAPEERRLSLLLALMTYGLLFLGIRFAWTHRGVEIRKPVPMLITTRLVYLADDSEIPVQQERGRDGGERGTGTIDPLLQELTRVKPRETNALDLDMLPTSLPQEQMFPSLNPLLPVAQGGDGIAKGHRSGSGIGNGAAAHGNGFLSGAKGDGPTLSIADMEVLHQEMPKYPENARAALVQGMVVLRVTIDEKGLPSNIDVVSGHSLLIPETLRAMKLWRFASVKYHGRAVSSVFTVSILYLLNNS